MTLYGQRDVAGRPGLQIATSRLPRMYAPGGTMYVMARGNYSEFYFAAPEEFEIGERASVPSAAPSS
jgi:hypothetical protein